MRARRELTAAALGLRLGLVRREESVMLVVRLVVLFRFGGEVDRCCRLPEMLSKSRLSNNCHG